MAARRTGTRRPPDRLPVLQAAWRQVIAQLGGGPSLVIGGKSMGGRIASTTADEEGVRGLVCLGYPFHPAGKPEQLRTAHLAALQTPTLILQGDRDPLGSHPEVESYQLSPSIRLAWLPDGDHSLRPAAPPATPTPSTCSPPLTPSPSLWLRLPDHGARGNRLTALVECSARSASIAAAATGGRSGPAIQDRLFARVT